MFRLSSIAARLPAAASSNGILIDTLAAGVSRIAVLQSELPLLQQTQQFGTSRDRHDHEWKVHQHRERWERPEHPHRHVSHRAPWLRAFVLGASDGLVSTASLLSGVGAANMDYDAVLLTGAAGLVAGSMSMAVGEYISVSSQRDAEQADIEIERQEQLKGPEARARELDELTVIYIERGVPPPLARQVAVALTEKDPVRAHARDELGIDIDELANPWQAALVSAATFAMGAGLPLAAAALVPDPQARSLAVAGVATLGLAGFGVLSARLGGASLLVGGGRVVLGGWLAMGITYGIGSLFNVPVG